jgi:hypothetical protein
MNASKPVKITQMSNWVKKTPQDSKLSIDKVSSCQEEHANDEHQKYNNQSDVIQKMSKSEPMKLKDMRILAETIKKLDQEAHIEICKMIVEGDVNYIVNNYGTSFDLVDLDPGILWRIYYYCNLSMEDIERQKIKDDAQKQLEKDLSENMMYQRMKYSKTVPTQNIYHQTEPTYSCNTLLNYEDIAQDALRNIDPNNQSLVCGSYDITDTNEEENEENEEENDEY